MKNGAHFGAVLRLNGIGVIPEIEAVGIAVVKPQAGVVRMVDAFAGKRIQRIAASYSDALIVNERDRG